MKDLRLAFLFLLTLIFITTINAQTPSYYKLGEEELSGYDIYDIIQDNQKNYWLATDQGLIKYDGYTFKNIKCEKALSSSVFDLQLDYNNNLYCKNLSGQLFQIKDNKCTLFFQIPDSLMSSYIYYAFDKRNNLFVASNSIFKVNTDKTLEIFTKKNAYYTELLTLNDSSLIVRDYNSQQTLHIKDGQITTEHLKYKEAEDNIFLQFFYLNDTLYYYDKNTGNILLKDKDRYYKNHAVSVPKNKNERLRFHSTNQNLWIARQAGGVLVYNKNLQPLYQNKTIFRNSIISCIFKDHEGNTLLGTFGNGLIIIPNIHLSDIETHSEQFTKITSSSDNSIFIGTQSGKIYKINQEGNQDLFWNKQNKNIEVLYYFKENNTLLIDGKVSTFVHLVSKKERVKYLGTIKDISATTLDNYIIATSKGVLHYNVKLDSAFFVSQFSNRTNCVALDIKNNTIYAGTASGLKIGNEKESHYFKLDNSPVICRDVLYFDDKIFIATQKKGILIFKDNKLIEIWDKNTKLISNKVKHIKTYGGNLFISTDKGIQQLNKKGETLSILNKSNGLPTNSITDFEIRNDVLWVIHQKGIQTININHLTSFDYTPTITLSKIMINDSLFSTQSNSFTYQQNKFEFYISANSLKYKNEIHYYHQLIGIDKDWQVNSYSNNKIEYKSLPAGNYTFQVKATCRDKETEIIFYNFVITPPLWNTWWFYLLIFLAFIATAYLIFKREIKKQRKKIQLENELNASKLIAIQSQMNPHFIFNAINSIQDLILKGDIDNSYSYIIKFSKLVRQTLNFSDKEFIDIEDEIDLLKIYLELEKLRFKADFEYTITCDVADIQVPPMLIQPFIENAIKHGLLHKEGLKKLNISFNKDKTLYCTVTDNGIGREKSQEIKARQQKNHQSFSVDATRSRFEIMQSHYQQDLGVNFEDLKENGKPSGTKVIINMPFKQNY